MSINSHVAELLTRRTKIVATLGPASVAPAQVARLVRAGVNVFRLNMSHGDHAGHAEAYATVRATAARLGQPVAVLADLCGPKIRVGRFAGGAIQLRRGETVTVTTRAVQGKPGLIPSQYRALARDTRAGQRLLLADGALELRVEAIEGSELRCRVVHGGTLGDRKGINLPDAAVSAPALTAKDRVDARFALGLGVDFLALSFVRSDRDVHALRRLVRQAGGEAAIVAKIERPEALADSDAIVAAADALMVARGDLGVELPPEEVPVAQHRLIDAARRAQKPVIVATQMLESMITQSRPTRAEVTDIAHSVVSGADAVMLSAETASGSHPVAAVTMMDRIARQTEGYLWEQGAFGSITDGSPDLRSDRFGAALARATAQLSRDLQVRAIVVISRSGTTTAEVCSARPAAPVLAVSPDPRVCRRVCLLWGAIPVEVDEARLEDPVALAREVTREGRLARRGQAVLLVRGFHADPLRNTPSVTVVELC
ncbi:MAG TPA: pyruvate kinase [Gammaproteobacteria bacterium]